MDEATVKKIHEARCYLSSLPDTLPATGPESSANALLSFSLNPRVLGKLKKRREVDFGCRLG